MTDWQALREIHLQALQDAPDAFASTYARESAFGSDEWRRRATRDGSLIAFLPEVSPAGLGGGYLATPEVVELIGMFVRPQARGRGVGEAVIDTVVVWARQQDASTVDLWVTETNKHARLLYERCGVHRDRRAPAAALQSVSRRDRHDTRPVSKGYWPIAYSIT